MRLGAAHDVSACDASYVALPRRLRGTFVTADARFASKVGAPDVVLLRECAEP